MVGSLLAVVMGIITAILVSNKTQKAVFVLFGFASAILANLIWEIIYRLDSSLMLSGVNIVFALLFTFVIAIMLLVLVIRKTFKSFAGIIMLVSILVNFIFLILFLALLIASKGLLSVPLIRMSIIMIVFSHLMFLTGIIVNNVQLMTADSEQDEEDYNEQTSDGGDYSDDFGVSTASADTTSAPSEQGNVDDFFGSLLEETPASSAPATSKAVKPVDSKTETLDKPVDNVEYDDFFSEEKPVVKQSSEVSPTATSATETTPTSPVENRTMPDKPVNPGIKAKPMARVMTNAKPASTKVDTGNNEPKKTV